MLELRCGREKNIGIVRSICLEMLEYNRKQVGPFESGQNPLLVRCNSGRIAVVDNDRANRWFCIHQCIAQTAHIDCSWIPTDQIRLFECRIVVFKESAGAQYRSTAGITPGTDKGGQAENVADSHAASGMPLQSIVDANEGRGIYGVFMGDAFD